MTKPARGGAALGGFALLILGGELRDVVVQALSLILSSLLQAAFSNLWMLVIFRPSAERATRHSMRG